MRVAINGIGIAGPTLAYWLRQHGHEPVLFEKSPTPRTGGYLIDFWGLGYTIAERMGILDGLRTRGYQMQHMVMFDRRGAEQARLDLKPMRDALQGRFFSVARSDLANALFGACSGIPAHFGVSVTGLEPEGRGSLVSLSDGTREHFDAVVGADGLHSGVRALAFGEESGFERFLDCYVAAFRIAGYPNRAELTYVSHTVRRRQVARVSLRDDETLVLLVWRPEHEDVGPVRGRDAQQAMVKRRSRTWVGKRPDCSTAWTTPSTSTSIG